MAVRIAMGLIKDGSNELECVVNPKELGLEGSLVKGELYILVNVYKLSHQLDMKVCIKGNLNLECDRCLEMYEMKFEKEFEMVYVSRGHDEKIEDDDYLRVYSPFMRYIDITKDIKDFVELSVPMRKVPDEKPDGSCSWCGRKKEYWDSFITQEDRQNI